MYLNYYIMKYFVSSSFNNFYIIKILLIIKLVFINLMN
jgi:hypothetical protein